MSQVQLAKMERLHERQQNVMRRKIEETVAVNKRLKDALEKKAMVRAQKGGDKVLAGSGKVPVVPYNEKYLVSFSENFF
jgi:hypothetical protein